MESKGKIGTGLELVNKMSAGAVESVRVAVSRSDEKVGEFLRSSGENKRKKKKKKSKPIREEEKADVKAFSGSFADYLTHLQEDEEERDQRKLNEKLKKAAALEAKKKSELNSALSFIDGQLQPGSDLSEDDEEKQTADKEEESMFQSIKNFKCERRESCEDWTSQLTWGEIRGQGQSSQMSEFLQAPSTVSRARRKEVSENIPGGKVHSKVKVEEDFEDRESSRVTQDMCSTSVSTDSKPQVMKMERVQDVGKDKLRLFVQSGRKKFQVSLEGHKRVKKVRVAVAGQLHVSTHRVQLQVI